MTEYDWTPETTDDEVVRALQPQIAGQTILITGVSPNSLGAQVAKSIASGSPSTIILASRSPSSMSTLASEISTNYPSVRVQQLVLDLSSLARVRAAATEFLSWEIQLDVLINNAGIMAGPFSLTLDGFESQFGTNYVGHWLFTNLLLPRLRTSGRVINVASDGHQYSDILWSSRGAFTAKNYDQWQAYGQSKTGNMLFSVELAKRGIASLSLHPGVILTNLARSLDTATTDRLWKELEDRKVRVKTLPQGAATYVVAAFQPGLGETDNGKWLCDCRVMEPLKGYASDTGNARRLWGLTEELVGQSF